MINPHLIAEQIAPFLPGWRFNRVLSDQADNWRKPGYLTKDHTAFYIGPDWRNEKRFKAMGEHSSHSITFNPERAPQALAGDIQRRFLPQYLKDVAEYRHYEKTRQESAKERELRLHALQHCCPNLREAHHSGEYYFDRGVYREGYNKDSHSIEFSGLTFDQVVQIAFFANQLRTSND